MQITKAGEYGVRGLINLARRSSERAVMIEDVSREENISRSFLGKIFQSLVRAGIIRSNRGARGGFILMRRPEEISVLDIIEAIEGKIALQRCLLEAPDCRLLSGCAFWMVLHEAQAQVRKVFARTTLADLLQKQAVLNASGSPIAAAQTPATGNVN